MATFTFTIPDAALTRVVNAFALQHDYQSQVPNPAYDPLDEQSEQFIANPETKAEFMKRKIREFVKNSVSAAETKAALDAARSSIAAPPDIT